MKKINIICFIFISIFLLSASNDQPQRKFYYAFDEKIPLYEAENKVVVSFDKKHLSEIRTNLQRNAKISNMECVIEDNYAILTTKENKRVLKEELKKQAGIKSVNPMYLIYGGTEAPVTDEICVQFKEHVSQKEIENLLRKYRLTVKSFHQGSRSEHLSVPVDLDLLEVANAIQESGLVNYSHPDLLLK
jgi:hypothetical protein